MALLLVPVMTVMWLCTTGCVKLMIPKLTTLTAMVIASLVTSTDPVLSQAIAKGPFADKYVPRALREIISAEAGSNDGFGFPFLLLATYLIRHTPEEDVNFKPGVARIAGEGVHRMLARAGDVGRLGGGAGQAVEIWIVEGWLYFILLGAVVGAVLGIASMFVVSFTLKRYVLHHTYTLQGLPLMNTSQQMDRYRVLAPLPHRPRPLHNRRHWSGRPGRPPRLLLRRRRLKLERHVPARDAGAPRRSQQQH